MLTAFAEKHLLGQGFIQTAQQWYVALAQQLYLHQRSAGYPLFVGINGCQGSGKSTLSSFLRDYLQQQYQLNVVALSLDDFYLDRQRRLVLAEQVHPLLATRGVPGTHNTHQIHSLLTSLGESGHDVLLPQFNKATDNPLDKSMWPRVTRPVDIVLFEGWCWGVSAQSNEQLQQPVNQLERIEDADGNWRYFVNHQLAASYKPLYRYMHKWLMLKAPSFDNVLAWRTEQEHKLAAKVGMSASALMSDWQIQRFIQHYQRLTEHALSTLPAQCHWVFELDESRNIRACITRDGYEL